jgi:hypothetical protein
LAHRRGGGKKLYATGQSIPDDELTAALFVRDVPIELVFDAPQTRSADGFTCVGKVRLAVRILSDPAELEAFRDRVLGSKSVAQVDVLESYLHSAIGSALQIAAGNAPAEALVDGRAAAQLTEAIGNAIQPLLFAGGLTLEGSPAVAFSSDGVIHARQMEERASRIKREQQSQSEISAALHAARKERLTDLEGMLARLKTLAEGAPGVATPQLLKAFNEVQRGELYQALLASHARERVTQWLVVAAGGELIYFDPQSSAEPARRQKIEGPFGALRSVQHARADRQVLLIGAATGVYVLSGDSGEPVPFGFESKSSVRGGVNAAALHGVNLVATHSELGVLQWNIDDRSAKPKALFADVTAGAKAVRHAQFRCGRFWCSVDDMVVSASLGEPADSPRVQRPSLGVITALHVSDAGVFLGTAEGQIARLPMDGEGAAEIMHSGSRRPAESVALQSAGGVPVLFYTDTSLAVHGRVLGDSFASRYEAGGQTIRRAEVAPDLIAATTDARDRVLLWTPEEPAHPSAVLAISRLTGHSVQDICLLPQSAT